MARPVTYKNPRVDTKVRIRQDQADALEARVEETGLSRNRHVEAALDLYLGQKAPRLKSTPADPNLTRSSETGSWGQPRTKPRLAHPGQAHATQSEAAARKPNIVERKKTTKRSPRRPMR